MESQKYTDLNYRRSIWAVVALLILMGLPMIHWLLLNSPASSYTGFTSSLTGVSDLREDYGLPNVSNQTVVQTLFNDLRAAAVRANGGKPVLPLSAKEKEKWHRKNPCRSRAELEPMYTGRNFVDDLPANPEWKAVFREYEILHRVCTQKVGNLAQYFLTRETISGCKFVVADRTETAGLGNKILITTSTFLFAVLTQRVLLVPSSNLLTDVMCEPFEGSSWKVDLNESRFTQTSWNSTDQFLRAVDAVVNSKSSTATLPSKLYATEVTSNFWEPHVRFYCPTEQDYLAHVTWVHVVGCLYFLPKLFAVPVFRPTLEGLFPRRMVFTHLLRSLMLPGDPVWRRVTQVQEVHLRHASRCVGIQVRYRNGKSQFDEMHERINARIKQCAVENGILPQPGSASDENKHRRKLRGTPSTHNPVRVINVLIASLYQDLHDLLSNAYLRNPSANGDAVGIIQLSHGQHQSWSLEEDQQALTEIFLLSFSDDIFVTPLSTFGGVAHGYGALKPWFIEIRSDKDIGCVRGQTVDTCYQFPQERRFSCPHDAQLNGKNILNEVPYIKDCLNVDADNGIQLITSSQSRR